MIRLWFTTLARKLLSGQWVPTPGPPGWRPGARLHLEPLEERTVASIVSIDPPELAVPQLEESGPAVSSEEIATPSTEGDVEPTNVLAAAVVDDPGLDKLLEDLQQAEQFQFELLGGGEPSPPPSSSPENNSPSRPAGLDRSERPSPTPSSPGLFG